MMKTKYFILFITTLATIIMSCEKEENEMPDIDLKVGSPLFRQDISIFYKIVNDTLYQYAPDNKTDINYSYEDKHLMAPSVNLDIENMYSETLFPSIKGSIACLVGDKIEFSFKGVADGVVMFYGDSVAKDSHRYEDFPYASGNAIDMNLTKSFGSTAYTYKKPGLYTATMVARNFWRTDEEAKEDIIEIKVLVLDTDIFNYIK